MNKERENMKEVFEEMLFGPLNAVFGSQVSDEVRIHLSQARIEMLKAMKVFIDSEIEKIEKNTSEK